MLSMQSKMMSETDPSNTPSLFGEAFRTELRAIIIDAFQAVLTDYNGSKQSNLCTPEELADRLKVPVSWVYEQSRQGNIPTHRLGRYIRFDLHEVLASQKKD